MKLSLQRVGDIADQIRGVTYRKQEASKSIVDGFVPVLRAGNITEEGLVFDDLVYVPASKVSAKQLIRKNDILIAASSGSLDVVGKAARATDDFDGGFGAFCKVLRPQKEVDPSYFAQFFKTPHYRRTVSFLAEGANINNLRNEDLDGLQIPLPPLAEQKRIAAILDVADALRAKRRQAIAKLDELLQSTFLDMFGDPVTNPKGWEQTPLGETFDLKHGFAFKSENFLAEGKYVLLTPGNFSEKGGFRDQGKRQKYHDDPIPMEFLLEKGDLLIAMTEQAPGLLGSPIIVPETRKYLHNQRLGKVINKVDIESRFIFELMNTASIRKRIQQDSTGTKVKHTSPNKISKIEIGLPPISIQRQFASIVTKIEAQKSRLRTHLAELDTLFASLQSRAFKGEL